MPKPITPLVSVDAFITNDSGEVLLIKRADSGVWATPGGFVDVGETPAAGVVREVMEETGLEIEVVQLLGVFSSLNYKYHYYKWTDNEVVQILFAAKIVGGTPTHTDEALDVQWFPQHDLPELFDGHNIRIQCGFDWLKGLTSAPHFE
ncbi:MAG: NUDIX domain-containing protein [Ignavibacteria bacterium]|nr:NUDIX domain-containing protein [Ignavibacteria bacterium]